MLFCLQELLLQSLLFITVYAAASPHIVVVLVDDLGYHNVGFHGNPEQRSPIIDALAAEGAELGRHYTYKFCSPTRSAFLSGRLPIHVNEDNPAKIDSMGGIDLRMTLIPEKLKDAGYATAMIGKGHIGSRQTPNLPGERGFDYHFGFLTGGEDHFSQRGYEAENAFDLWQSNATYSGPAYGRTGMSYSCELYTAEATALVERHDSTTPLFLYLAYQNCHSPYQVPAQYKNSKIGYEGRRAMEGMLKCVDEGTGNDNGGPQYWNANNYPLRGGKGTDFEGGVRAAAFVAGGALRLPSTSRRGAAGQTVLDTLISVADWYRTFCALAGVDADDGAVDGVPNIDSHDYSALLTRADANSPVRKELVLSSNALLSGDLKFVLNTTIVTGVSSGYWTGATWPTDNDHTPLEPDPGCPVGGCLFNVTQDPTEHHELSKLLPQMRDALSARLDDVRASRFQSGDFQDPAYQNCTTIADYVAEHDGFAGPVCSSSTAQLSAAAGGSDTVRNNEDPYADWELRLLTEAAQKKGAVCLDGSPPGYYVKVGAEPARVMVHFQGGGWCKSLEDCAKRATTALGSSAGYADDKDAVLGAYDGGAHGLFSSDPEVNPSFHNWTKLYVRYCDGASFGGNVEAAQTIGKGEVAKVYFRGRRILDAVLDDLEPILSVADDFIVNGCSAGGLAIWLHLDYISARVRRFGSARVYGVPECGLFLDEVTYTGAPLWTPLYEAVDALQNVTGSGSADAGCLEAADGEGTLRSRCILAQQNLPHVETPFFAVNSVYDSWQGTNILAIKATCVRDPAQCSAAESAAFENLRVNMLGNLSTAPPVTEGNSTFFTYNCATHCAQFAHDDRWGELMDTTHSLSLRESFSSWYGDVSAGRGGGGVVRASAAPQGWGPAADASCT